MTCEGLTLWLIEKASIIQGHFTCLSTCYCMEEVTLWTGSRQLNLDKLALQSVPGGRLPRPWSHPALLYRVLSQGIRSIWKLIWYSFRNGFWFRYHLLFFECFVRFLLIFWYTPHKSSAVEAHTLRASNISICTFLCKYSRWWSVVGVKRL